MPEPPHDQFIIVLHSFWMDSIRFEQIMAKSQTFEEVEREAAALRSDREKQFNHCAYTIVPLINESIERRVRAENDNILTALIDLYGIVADHASVPDEEYHKITNAADLIETHIGPLRKSEKQVPDLDGCRTVFGLIGRFVGAAQREDWTELRRMIDLIDGATTSK